MLAVYDYVRGFHNEAQAACIIASGLLTKLNLAADTLQLIHCSRLVSASQTK